MKRWSVFIFLIISWSIFLVGQARSGVIVGEEQPMTVADVIRLLKAHIGDEVISEQISATHSVFTLSADDLIRLKKAGASGRLLQVMIRTGEESHSTSGYRVVTKSGRVEYHYRASGMGYPIILGPTVYPAISPIVIYSPYGSKKWKGYQGKNRLVPRTFGLFRLTPPSYKHHPIIRDKTWKCRTDTD